MHISFLNFVSEMWMQKHLRLHAFSSHDFFSCAIVIALYYVCCIQARLLRDF